MSQELMFKCPNCQALAWWHWPTLEANRKFSCCTCRTKYKLLDDKQEVVTIVNNEVVRHSFTEVCPECFVSGEEKEVKTRMLETAANMQEANFPYENFVYLVEEASKR